MDSSAANIGGSLLQDSNSKLWRWCPSLHPSAQSRSTAETTATHLRSICFESRAYKTKYPPRRDNGMFRNPCLHQNARHSRRAACLSRRRRVRCRPGSACPAPPPASQPAPATAPQAARSGPAPRAAAALAAATYGAAGRPRVTRGGLSPA